MNKELMYFNNPSGFCYVKPEPVKIEYREAPFTLDNHNLILFEGELFAWKQNKRGEKFGFGDDTGYILNLVKTAYQLGRGDKLIADTIE